MVKFQPRMSRLIKHRFALGIRALIETKSLPDVTDRGRFVLSVVSVERGVVRIRSPRFMGRVVQRVVVRNGLVMRGNVIRQGEAATPQRRSRGPSRPRSG